jgi:hypothetical protein
MVQVHEKEVDTAAVARALDNFSAFLENASIPVVRRIEMARRAVEGYYRHVVLPLESQSYVLFARYGRLIFPTAKERNACRRVERVEAILFALSLIDHELYEAEYLLEHVQAMLKAFIEKVQEETFRSLPTPVRLFGF